MTSSLPIVNMLWIGESLGPIERACLRSALRQGHPVRLFAYEPLSGAPEGVEIADAAKILPAERIIRHRGGSVSLFSNHFRYALQRDGLGMWTDIDHYFLKPHDFPEPYVLGRQRDGQVNGAVLEIPSDAPLLARLLDLFDNAAPPAWISERERARLEKKRGRRFSLETAEWGIAGPRALTHLVAELGLDEWVKPEAVFYPADFTEAAWILDPARTIDDIATAETLGVHLWNEKIKTFKNTPAPAGSFLARLQEEGR